MTWVQLHTAAARGTAAWTQLAWQLDTPAYSWIQVSSLGHLRCLRCRLCVKRMTYDLRLGISHIPGTLAAGMLLVYLRLLVASTPEIYSEILRKIR